MDIKDIKTLLKILTEWSFKNKEYSMSLFIYTNFNIGIPNRFIYKLPDKNIFLSVSSFINENENKVIDSEDLQKLTQLFKRSKYMKLESWDNSYGYKN